MIGDLLRISPSLLTSVLLCACGMIALSLSFVFVAALGRPTIVGLRRLSFRQKAYEDAPASHAVKTGTPTMGGVLFIFAMIALAILNNVFALQLVLANAAGASPGSDMPVPDFRDEANSLIGLAIGCGIIGLVDDLMGILLGRNRGLGAREKFALTAIVAGAFLYSLTLTKSIPMDVLAFGGLSLAVPVWVWLGVSFLAIVSTTHAVNLTDGLDGLAAGTIVPPLLLLVFAAAVKRDLNGIIVASVAIGAVLGFLIYNRHPAKLFMGDTGSLLLGGLLAGSAIVLDQQLLLPLIGGVFVAEALSVIIQVTYFKRTGKRIFKMSPLHHHFELVGWPETKVTTRFWLASLVLSLVGLATTFVPRAAI